MVIVMKNKPDLLWVLACLFGLGVLLSTYSQGEIDPEKVALKAMYQQVDDLQ